MQNNKVSVIIPVKNEEKGLKNLLKAIIAQNPNKIIVVDAGSEDNTLKILEEYSKNEPRLKFIKKVGALPGKGRNIGILNTDDGIIAQIDGGCMPESNWLFNLINPIKQGRTDYVMGNIKPMKTYANIFGKRVNMGDIFSASIYKNLRGTSYTKKKLMAGGASVAYRRTIWEKAGGFPDWLRCGEDVLFAGKVYDMGVKFEFVEDAVVYWQMGPNIIDVFKRWVRYIKGNALFDPEASLIKKIFKRTIAASFILMLSYYSNIFLFLFIILALAFWLKNSIKGIKIYKQRTGKHGLLEYLLIFRTELILIIAEEIGMFLGIINRIIKRDAIKKLYEYKSMKVTNQ